MTPRKKSETPRTEAREAGAEPGAKANEKVARASTPAQAEDALAAKQRECQELLDRYQRLAAEFSNYQKRAERRAKDEREEAVGDLVLDVLLVIDNFERAIAAAEATPDFDAFLKGVGLVHDQLLAALKKHGVTPIEAADRAFDPEHHEAVAHLPSDAHPTGRVMEEVRKGYRLGERTLRASRVAVSSGEPQAETDEAAAPSDASAAAADEDAIETDE